MQYEEFIIYLAGFFDGEGNINLYHHKPTYVNRYGQYALQVRISQKKREGLDQIIPVFRGKIIKIRYGWQWTSSGSTAAYFLKQISPYLQSKRIEAAKAIEFQMLIGKAGRGKGQKLTEKEIEIREKLYQEFREIREIGKPPNVYQYFLSEGRTPHDSI